MEQQNQRPNDETPPESRRPRRFHRHLSRATVWTLEALGVLAAGAVILVAVFAYRLSQGPVSVNFLSRYVVEAIEGIDPGIHVAIGDTVLIWSTTGETLQLRARGVHVHGPDGEDRASVPELSIALSIPALFHGLIAPSSLEIYGLHVRLVRTDDGKIQFGNSGPEPSVESTPTDAAPTPAPTENTAALSNDAIKALIGLFAGAPDPTLRGSYLHRISVVDAEFILDDQKTGHVWRAPEAHLSIVRDQAGAEGRVAFAVDVLGSRPRLDVSVRYRPGDTTLAVEANLSDLDPAAIATAVAEPLVAPLGALEAPLVGKAHAAVGLDGSVQSVALTLDAGAGRIFYPRLGLGGDEAGVPINHAHLDAHFSDALDLMTVDHLNLDLDGARLEVMGDATLSESVPVIHLDVRVASLPVPVLKRYWPEKASAHTHTWVVENIEEGTAEDVHFSVELGPYGHNGELDAKTVDGEFRLRDVSLAFFRPLPNAREMSGSAKMTTDTLTFTVDSGKIGGLTVDDGKVVITGMNVHDQDIEVEATAHGPLVSAFEILDNPRLGYIKQLGLKSSEASGDMATRLRIRFPLESKLTFEQVELLANSNLRNVSIPKVALGLDVTEGNLALVVDKKGLSMQGKAKVAGADADIKWQENFENTAGFLRRIHFQGTLDDAARETAGLSFAPFITGPISAEALITQYDSHYAGVEVTADLTPATVTVSDFGWGKDPDEKGTAVIRATLRDDKLATIDQLELRAHDLTVSGRLRLTNDGKGVESAVLPKVAFGESDVQAKVSRNANGAYVIRVNGPQFNVEPLLNARDDDDEKPGTPMVVDAALGFARLSAGGGASGVSAHLERDSKHWNIMTIDGGLASAKPIAIRMNPDGNGRTFSVMSADAGAALKALDITGNVIGGSLRLSGRYVDTEPHSPFKGTLEMRDYRLEGAPLVAKVLSVASLTGILNVLTGQGIDFSQLNATITYVGGTVYTDDLRAHGSALGFTGKGSADLRKQTIDLQGTVVPAYTLNSILGNIPLLGSILTGPEGGGVFAANYRMRGSIDNPDVSVNPLSTLTPGILRNIFNIFDKPVPTAPPAAGAPPPQNPANPAQ